MQNNREVRTESLATRFTHAEAATLRIAADSSGKPLREWMRDRLLAAARQREEDDPLFIELIALRMLLNSVLENLAGGRLLSPAAFSGLVSQIRARKRDTARKALAEYAEASGFRTSPQTPTQQVPKESHQAKA